ncbi:hypothetical protein [Mucilaginibacter endophyticus]|uniref:hypothetical protein n=1 Tax=Mucilaginibacter endophyticus TaxID=2675003 RepID=UPI000E0DDCF2|nr:hypothetical protein [Mucilaginibacter endophyticus]
MNADIFQDSALIYDYEFNQIMDFVLQCYHLMLKKYQGKQIENNENKIRNRLYKDFLNSNQTRQLIDIFPCRFECECAEIDTQYKEIGYTDIKVLTTISLSNSDAYYIIECKRIDGSRHLNNEYIKEGVFRFVDVLKYPSYNNVCGMIGFVVKEIDTDKNIQNLNEILIEVSSPAPLKLIEQSALGRYTSIHTKTNNKPLKVSHLMLDYSSIV